MTSEAVEGKYQPKGETFFDDGREIALLHHIHSLPNLSSIRNDPTAVLAAIDGYARTTKYLMNVGPEKGRIVSDLISERAPTVMVELGGYIGYSCILFGDALRRASGAGAKYYSLERNPEFAAVIMCLVALAGLSDVVEVVVGSSDESLRRLQAQGAFQAGCEGEGGIDLMFLDHYKPAYVTDLKLCEELGLVKKGTVLAGDNCIEPGNPAYLEWVRATCEEKRELVKKDGSRTNGNANGVDNWDQRIKESAVKQYDNREGQGRRDINVKGRPELIYESRMVESFEPTGEKDGVEITRCVGQA